MNDGMITYCSYDSKYQWKQWSGCTTHCIPGLALECLSWRLPRLAMLHDALGVALLIALHHHSHPPAHGQDYLRGICAMLLWHITLGCYTAIHGATRILTMEQWTWSKHEQYNTDWAELALGGSLKGLSGGGINNVDGCNHWCWSSQMTLVLTLHIIISWWPPSYCCWSNSLNHRKVPAFLWFPTSCNLKSVSQRTFL